MKRFLDFLMNSASAVVILLLALVGIIMFAIPAAHPFAWVVGIIVCLVIAAAVLLQFREWLATTAQVDALHAELGAERGSVVSVGMSPIDIDTTNPDTDKAEDVLSRFPAESGLVQNLRQESAFGIFPRTQTAALDAFLGDYAKSSFDNPRIHTAFMNLYRSAEALATWFNTETTASPRQESAVEVTPGDRRQAGWAEYSQARDQGEQLGDGFVAAVANFRQTALECRILP